MFLKINSIVSFLHSRRCLQREATDNKAQHQAHGLMLNTQRWRALSLGMCGSDWSGRWTCELSLPCSQSSPTNVLAHFPLLHEIYKSRMQVDVGVTALCRSLSPADACTEASLSIHTFFYVPFQGGLLAKQTGTRIPEMSASPTEHKSNFFLADKLNCERHLNAIPSILEKMPSTSNSRSWLGFATWVKATAGSSRHVRSQRVRCDLATLPNAGC